MKIYCYYKSGSHQESQIKNFVEGLKKHNIECIEKTQFNPQDDPDLAVFWSHRKLDIIQYMRKNNKPYIVMERAFVGDRFHWSSIGFNGLNGRADFRNKDIVDISRWNKHFEHLYPKLPHNPNSNKVLVIGQVMTDAAVAHVDINKWYSNTIHQLNQMGYDVIFRPHPLNKCHWENNKLKYTIDKHNDCIDTFKTSDLKFAVTFSSNSGVLSILHGIPTVSIDEGSMIYDITSHDISNPTYPDDDMLTQWKARLAYTQWSPDEIKRGDFYDHIFKGLK